MHIHSYRLLCLWYVAAMFLFYIPTYEYINIFVEFRYVSNNLYIFVSYICHMGTCIRYVFAVSSASPVINIDELEEVRLTNLRWSEIQLLKVTKDLQRVSLNEARK